ncbi:hypothetical protein RRG08_034747, partial [Elysia crispata]
MVKMSGTDKIWSKHDTYLSCWTTRQQYVRGTATHGGLHIHSDKFVRPSNMSKELVKPDDHNSDAEKCTVHMGRTRDL